MRWVSKLKIILLLTGLSTAALAQVDHDTSSVIPLKAMLPEVVVSAFKDERSRETSLNLTPVQLDSLSRFGGFTLTDALTRVPGIQMLSTGTGISRPVIRGLSGNRVLVLLSGLKFDNQQWQEEHGMGLSDLGLARVEVVKGPLSVLYGSEAVGGVLNLIEELPVEAGTRRTDIGLRLNGNTRGGRLEGGYRANNGKSWTRVRVAAESYGDYSDGGKNRVLNSRFDGYYLKATKGFKRGSWTSNNHFISSFNRFGFIFNDLEMTPDARWSRTFTNPCHLVLLNILSSENRIYLGKSSLTVNAGLQSNKRMENEGSGQISLDMHLLTGQYLLKWERELRPETRLIISHLAVAERNTNYGSRKIVPDADMQEANLGVYLERNFGKVVLENGVGAGGKRISTRLTPTVNSAEKDIKPFVRSSPYFNFLSGLSFIPNQYLNLKVNVATGVRMPNLAELSSNGLHEGVFTYEIGDPDLENERITSGNLYLNLKNKWAELTGSLFYNRFQDYVYLAPTKEDWYGFPVYRYLQQDAQQQGGELSLNLRPFGRAWEAYGQYAAMTSRTNDGNFTPFLPPPRYTAGLAYSYQFQAEANGRKLRFYAEQQFSEAQFRLAPGEQRTSGYVLLNAGAQFVMNRNNAPVEISLAGTNLLDRAYADHLSRLKNLGLLNLGRNVILQLRYTFD